MLEKDFVIKLFGVNIKFEKSYICAISERTLAYSRRVHKTTRAMRSLCMEVSSISVFLSIYYTASLSKCYPNMHANGKSIFFSSEDPLKLLQELSKELRRVMEWLR